MDEKDIQQIKEAFEEKLSKVATKEEFEAVKTEIEALKSKDNKAELEALKTSLEAKLTAQWEEVLKLSNEGKKETAKTFSEHIKDAILKSGSTEEYVDEETGITRYRIKGLDGSKKELAFKVAVDMNTANAVRPGSSPGVNVGFLTDYGMQPQQLQNTLNQHFLNSFASQTTTEKYFGVIVEVTETDGADVKAEASVAGDSSYLWKSIEYKVFDFAVKFRVHQNTLDDMDNVINRITTLGTDRLLTKIDYYTLGAAGDNSATPYGLKTTNFFTAYDTTLRQGEVQGANIVNVIKNMVLQARNAKRLVDTLIIHPNDAAEIEDLKDQNNNTVNLAGVKVGPDGKLAYIYGLKVIINDNMTTNTCIVCSAMESLQYGIRGGLNVRMGYDQTTDFSKGIVTVQLETRLAVGIGAPDGIIYCSDIATAAAALSVV